MIGYPASRPLAPRFSAAPMWETNPPDSTSSSSPSSAANSKNTTFEASQADDCTITVALFASNTAHGEANGGSPGRVLEIDSRGR
jgi:hypothetical protein